MAWFYLDWSGNFLNTALLNTRLLKSLYSLDISPSISFMLSLLLLIFNSSFLHASSSKLTNNTVSFSSIVFSSGSLGTYILLYHCRQFCRLMKEFF